MNAETRLVGLMGWPVRHSASPQMHNAAFAALGLNWAYVPLPVEAGRVGEAVRGLRALGMRGANVTVPHKQAVMEHLDLLTPAAQAIGAVNTIVVAENGALHGENTDAPGFVADLAAHGVSPVGASVAILGAGGSARAVAYAVASAGARRVVVLNRSQARATELVSDLSRRFPACSMEAGQLDGGARAASNANLVINCTSLGMAPRVEAMPWEESVPFRAGQVVYDLVYNPMRTRLLEKAESDGALAIGGLGMLVWQGALAFQRWTGVEPPVPVMEAAARRAR